MGEGEDRGEVRELRDACDNARDSRGASVEHGVKEPGEHGEAGGEGEPEVVCLETSLPALSTREPCFGSEDFVEPYCE